MNSGISSGQDAQPEAGLPRASLVLIAYNQEKFIEAAVSAAFAQNYANLEIILSDDNSTDSTFDRMQAMAATYAGPYSILLNRAPGGRGILAHIYDAVAKASGRLIVVAAGDDLSYPDRVSILIEAWQATGADAIISGFDRIDEFGRVFDRIVTPPQSEYDPAVYFDHGDAMQLTGCCAAYDRSLFDKISLPVEPILAEDYFFSLVLGLRSRRSRFVEAPLVAYRVHDRTITHAGSGVGVKAYEEQSACTASMIASLLRLVERMAREGTGFDHDWGKPAKVDFRRLARDQAYLDYRSRWMTVSFRERSLALVRFREPHQSRWLLPRTFGLRFLVLIKWLQNLARGPERHGSVQ